MQLFHIPEYDFQVLALFRIQFAGQLVQEYGHKLIDRRQRRPKLVRHVRQELILELHLVCPDHVAFCLHAVALDGMAKRPGQRAIFDLPFNQIVLWPSFMAPAAKASSSKPVSTMSETLGAIAWACHTVSSPCASDSPVS